MKPTHDNDDSILIERNACILVEGERENENLNRDRSSACVVVRFGGQQTYCMFVLVCVGRN